MIPAGLKYTKEHVWVRLEEGAAVVGVTDHAQRELGDVVFVELPAAGAAVSRGKALGVVESVKAVSDIIAPLDGTVLRVNEALAKAPELVNRDPYGGAWMVALAPADPAQLAGLLDAPAYEEHLRETGGQGA
jgi:glycine cleavage system H protein